MLRVTDGILARFTRDLTADARVGRLETVRCRADEIERVMDILLRQGKNNPALVGPSGVGKTAIVEGLAQRVAAGTVPLSLRDIRILAVDHVSLLAGTTYRGQYEERIRALVAETSAASDAVLFIDELHNLIGQGTAMGVAMDAANMLKPALVRGEFRVIGATTDDEYERWVCGDPALERRFQKVAVRELTAEETLDILRSRRERLERHHNVVIADEALEASIRLTDQHLVDRHRPDRAIDALDEAAAHTHGAARYSTGTEALILERREALREAARRRSGSEGGRRDGQATDRDVAGEDNGDRLDQMARNGFKALSEFGAELEAILVGPVQAPRPAASQPAAADAPPAASRAAGSHRTLAELEAELTRRLTEEGIVVRGHDVARVVALTSGKTVTWDG